MDNFVEEKSFGLALSAMRVLDPGKERWVIDAGAGNGNFWFEMLYDYAGYRKIIAVDPFPTLPVEERCERMELPLVRAALAGETRDYDLYWDGAELYSLIPDLWEPPLTQKKGLVRGTTVRAVCETHGIPLRGGVSLVKLDIEGMEPDVIESMFVMQDVTSELVFPDVIVFEFGGQGPMKDAKGPWSDANIDRLRETLLILDGAGYELGFVVSEGAGPRADAFRDPEYAMSLIRPETTWGNIVAFRNLNLDDLRSWT